MFIKFKYNLFFHKHSTTAMQNLMKNFIKPWKFCRFNNTVKASIICTSANSLLSSLANLTTSALRAPPSSISTPSNGIRSYKKTKDHSFWFRNEHIYNCSFLFWNLCNFVFLTTYKYFLSRIFTTLFMLRPLLLFLFN